MIRLAGVILCGGRSSRMGRDKAWIEFRGEPLLARTVRLVGESTSSVIVAAGSKQDLPLLPDKVLIVRDDVAFQGPLAGIATAFAALPDSVEAAYVTGCDMPLLQAGWIDFLSSYLDSADIVLPVVQGREHPLAAVY